jgi:SET domain
MRLAFPLIVVSLARPVNTLVALSKPTLADELMHKWCESMEISINPSAQIITTAASVAGRGVFVLGPLSKNEIVAAIPTYAMFHPRNAGSMFPEVAATLKKRKQQCSATQTNLKRDWFAALKHRLFRRFRRKEDEEIPWQAELTEYAMVAVRDDHAFAPWIRQWARDDPVLKLFQSGATRDDEEAVDTAAKELNRMLPQMPLCKIMAALTIRMEQFESHQVYLTDPTAAETASMYSTLCSRAIGVTEDIVAVVPFHDMINHSFQPNLGLEISDDGRYLEIYALDNIPAGKELTFCYSSIGKEYDEDAALWMLVQWGIPATESEWRGDKAKPKESTTKT